MTAGTIWLMSAAPARLAGGGTLDLSLTRIVSALLLCLVLAAVAAVLLKRGGGRVDLSAFRALRHVRAQPRIEGVESRRISAHADVCLIRCDGRDYLILSSAAAQQVLNRGPAA